MAREPVSQEKKDEILKLYRKNKTYAEIHKHPGIAKSAIQRIIREAKKAGLIEKRVRDQSGEDKPKKATKEKERPLDTNLRKRTEQKVVE
jgi:transposase